MPERQLLAIEIWFVEMSMRLLFMQGYLVVISTHMSEIGEELFSGQFYKGALTDLAYSPVLGHAVVAGPSGIKVRLLIEAERYFESDVSVLSILNVRDY